MALRHRWLSSAENELNETLAYVFREFGERSAEKVCIPVLPNLQFGRRESQHLQCGKTTICGCRNTTALPTNGGIVGLSHRGSRRINGKFVAN